MIPYIPEDSTGSKLKERVQPKGWEYLDGSFSWVNFTDPQTKKLSEIITEGELYEKYGDCVFIEPVGIVGEMVSYFNEHRQFPSKSYLFAGNKGIGKTAFIKLMAMTNLAEDHENVSYRTNGDEITLIDRNTREPFRINPVETETTNFETVQRALNNPGDTSNGQIEAHNAGTMRKADVDAVAESINQNLTLLGGRRVIILNEFDNVSKRQVPALKSALDPGGAIPDGLLIMADTNHLQKVRNSMGPAGMDRFEVAEFMGWENEKLKSYAQDLLDKYDAQFIDDTFKDMDVPVEEGPAELIARFASGSVRDMLGAVQKAVTFDQKLEKGDLDELLSEVSSDTDHGPSQIMHDYKRKVVRTNNTSAAGLVKQAIDRSVSLVSFCNELSHWLLRRHKGLVSKSAIADALEELRQAAQYNEGQPATEIKWISCARPLRVIAEGIQRRRQGR